MQRHTTSFTAIARPDSPSGKAVSIADFTRIALKGKVESFARRGWQNQQQSNWPEALAYYQEALTLLESLGKSAYWKIVVPVESNLASVLRKVGRHGDAEACYVRAINLMEAGDGRAEPRQLATLYSNLASLYQACEIREAAMNMQEKCVGLLENCQEPPGADLLTALKGLAALCLEAGFEARSAEALERINLLNGKPRPIS